MRHGHRDRAQTDDPANAEPLGQQPHRRDEPFPAQVRLHAGEQQKRRADAVVQRVQVELGFLVVGEMVGLERHQRPPRPVVQQFVDGERRHQLGVQRVLEVLGGQPDGVPGVREALEGVDHHRPAPVRRTAAAPGTPTRTSRSARAGIAALVYLRLSHCLASWDPVSRISRWMRLRPHSICSNKTPRTSHLELGTTDTGTVQRTSTDGAESLPSPRNACWGRSGGRGFSAAGPAVVLAVGLLVASVSACASHRPVRPRPSHPGPSPTAEPVPPDPRVGAVFAGGAARLHGRGADRPPVI